jgi:signal transduction histidine kinase
MAAKNTPIEIIPQAFPGISADEVKELIASSQIQKYPTGTVLCRENQLEATFYLLLEGSVEVSKTINNMERRMLKRLKPGSFFGEMALIHNAPRAATVTAKTDVSVMEIHKTDFDRVLQHSSSVSLAMVREISSRLRENDEMAIEDLRMRAAELARAYQRLAEQDLARREFLTNVAHELRTPLTSASGYLQLLQKNALPQSEIPNAIDAIGRSVQQITALVNDILFLQEMDLILPKFQAVDLLLIAEDVVAKYQEKAEANKVVLKLQAPVNLPQVSGDLKSLERALTSLVDNAVKFSPNGGRVTVDLAQEDNQLVIKVSDTGIGIAPERLPHIFDRFYHLDKSGEQLFSGVGLGLSITRQVIEQHNGKIEVESTLGMGTTFTIRLNIIRVVI